MTKSKKMIRYFDGEAIIMVAIDDERVIRDKRISKMSQGNKLAV